MTLAVVVATEQIGEAATAGLAYDGDVTVLDRLLSRLTALNVPDLRVVTRPGLAPALRKNAALSDDQVIESAGLADDLREIARLAAGTREPLLLLHADTVASDELLHRVVNGAKSEAAAVTGPWDGSQRPSRPPVRIGRHLVDSAGDRFHQVTNPNGVFRGVLRVGSEVAGRLAGAAEEAAGLVDSLDEQAVPVVTGEVAEHLEVFVDNDVDGALGRSRGAAILATSSPTGDDVVAVVLTALVRAGVRVTARDAGVLVCERVLDAREAAAARAAVLSVDEDRVRLDAAVKSDDGFFTTYAVSSYSKWIAKGCARVGLTPNMVTSISMAIAVVAAVWFAAGNRLGMVLGALLLYAAFVFDCVDGQLARYTRSFSTLGAWLDATFDRAKEYVVYAGLAAGSTAAAVGSAVHGGDVWPLAAGAIAVQTVRHMIDFAFSAGKRSGPPQPRPVRSFAEPGDGAAVRSGRAGGAGGVVMVLSSRSERIPGLRWAKKIVILPIGERFALIALTAALFNARVTFLALLVWGSLAALYTLTGRVLRSLAR